MEPFRNVARVNSFQYPSVRNPNSSFSHCVTCSVIISSQSMTYFSLYLVCARIFTSLPCNWIVGVFLVRALPEITPHICTSIPINMVYYFLWPKTSHVEKSQAMCLIIRASYFDVHVTGRAVSSCFNPLSYFSPSAHFPYKYSCERIIG